MHSGLQSDGSYYCKPCKATFKKWEVYMKHKATKRAAGDWRHYHCKFCGVDFVTQRAEYDHIQVQHPEEQELDCPGCGKGPFARAGALMGHIEGGECTRISIRLIEEIREKKFEFARNLEALTMMPVKGDYAWYMPNYVLRAREDNMVHYIPEVIEPITWGSNDFPALDKDKDQVRACKSEIQVDTDEWKPWGQTVTLFPDAPPAQRPTAEELETATAPSARVQHDSMDIDHPSHPSFNVARYESLAGGRWNCPKVGCTKVFKAAKRLIGHLRGPYHGDIRYECPSCHKIFKSLTSITSHVESSSARCRIRDSKDYDVYFDQLTAGLVSVCMDRHLDGTVAYEVPKSAREAFKGNLALLEKTVTSFSPKFETPLIAMPEAGFW